MCFIVTFILTNFCHKKHLALLNKPIIVQFTSNTVNTLANSGLCPTICFLWFFVPPCRILWKTDWKARKGEVIGKMGVTLFGETLTKIHDRKGMSSNVESPYQRHDIVYCHWSKVHCRVVQGTVLESKVEHTTPNTTAKKSNGMKL